MNVQTVSSSFASDEGQQLPHYQPSQLALFGARPAFSQPLHVGRPNIPSAGQILTRIHDILQRAWLTNDGKYVQQFERKIAAYAGTKHCVCTCNATAALQLAIRALEMTGEVIVPSLTFIATAHALSWQGVSPVFADVDPKSWNVDAAAVERLITSRTSGILGVHLFGEPCDVGALQEIADRHRLRLLFDASHAFGCSWGSQRIGGFGDAEVFSFHATKFVNAAEGGAVVTNNDRLAERLRGMRNFGFDATGLVGTMGINGKMSELSAAVGLTSLEHVRDLIQINQRNQEAYRRSIGQLPGITVREFGRAGNHNYQYVVVAIDADKAGLSRDDLLCVLRAENVLARRHFFPGCHRATPYSDISNRRSLPVTERLLEQVLLLPNGMSVSVRDIERIGELFKSSLSQAKAIGELLSKRRFAESARRRVDPSDVSFPQSTGTLHAPFGKSAMTVGDATQPA